MQGNTPSFEKESDTVFVEEDPGHKTTIPVLQRNPSQFGVAERRCIGSDG